MRKSIYVAAVTVLIGALPAQAQNASKYWCGNDVRRTNPMVDTSGLQPATMHRAPLRIQYVNDAPIITSVPQEIPQKQYVLPPLNNRATETVPGAVQVGNGLYVMTNNQPSVARTTIPGIEPLNHLQPAGFSSNIPSRGLQPRTNLQSASSTNLLGTMHPLPNQVVSGPPTSVPRAARSASTSRSPRPVFSYGPRTSIGTASSNTTVRTNLVAKLLNQVK